MDGGDARTTEEAEDASGVSVEGARPSLPTGRGPRRGPSTPSSPPPPSSSPTPGPPPPLGRLVLPDLKRFHVRCPDLPPRGPSSSGFDRDLPPAVPVRARPDTPGGTRGRSLGPPPRCSLCFGPRRARSPTFPQGPREWGAEPLARVRGAPEVSRAASARGAGSQAGLAPRVASEPSPEPDPSSRTPAPFPAPTSPAPTSPAPTSPARGSSP